MILKTLNFECRGRKRRMGICHARGLRRTMPLCSRSNANPELISRAFDVTERVTLITGASAGIGTELARVFASHGHRLALVARRADRLTALAAEITAAGGAAPIVIPCDLVQPDCGDKIAEALGAAGVEVEYVVNNAGFGLFGKAVQRDRADQLDMIAVNTRALTELSLRFSDQLIRHRGGLLNVGSIAGFLPGPGMAVYYATKAYVLSFTEAMRAELAPHGVRVTVLCPGPVPSEFQARAGFRPGFDSAVLKVLPADVAQQAYRGLMANKRAVMPGIGIKIVPFLLRLFPRSFILGAVGRLQLRQR
jgi:short-subunit dehydrogenase